MHHCINPNGQAVQLNFFLNHLYTLKNFINYFVNWNYIFRTLPLDKYLINKILTLALLKKKKNPKCKIHPGKIPFLLLLHQNRAILEA